MSETSFDHLLTTCTAPADPMFKAAELLSSAWGHALRRSWEMGRVDGYAAGYWQAEHEQAAAWHTMWRDVRATLDQPTQAELLERRRGAA